MAPSLKHVPSDGNSDYIQRKITDRGKRMEGVMSPPAQNEESKIQTNVSTTLLNQSNNHLYQYSGGVGNPNQQQVNKYMVKRQMQNREHLPQSNSNMHSGYQTQQTTNQSNNNTNHLMKVVNFDIADISTNLNNNSRNFLAR
mmetsp:Transcript_14725/g.14335  ORF Transcript_14725/g.14335 Transcript_14725/m.14335 type:complete len:142 (+) Transcript_14725:180-605(+)